MDDGIGKVCPFCKTEIKEGEQVKQCDTCGIPHHQACWAENKGCSTFGCSEQHDEGPDPHAMAVCSGCGATLQEGQAFCVRCGTPRSEVRKILCSQCGTELQPDQVFCHRCGQKAGLALDQAAATAIHQINANIEKGKKKHTGLLIGLAVAIVALGILGFIVNDKVQETKAAEAEAAYIADAQTFSAEVDYAYYEMLIIGLEIEMNWYTYIYDNGNYAWDQKFISVDDAVDSAQQSQSDYVESVEIRQYSIDDLYTSLRNPPERTDEDLGEIKTAVRELYDAYAEMYDCVIYVSGNYNQYTSDFRDTDDNVSEKLRALSNLLSAYE